MRFDFIVVSPLAVSAPEIVVNPVTVIEELNVAAPLTIIELNANGPTNVTELDTVSDPWMMTLEKN